IGQPRYDPVTITHSGTQDAPIIFDGGNRYWTFISRNDGTTGPSIAVQGAHDIVLKNLAFEGGQLSVADSARVTVDSDYGPAIGVAGDSTSITITRDQLGGGLPMPAIQVSGSGSGDLIAANMVGGGITVADTPGTDITGNTVQDTCYRGIAVTGEATGSV